MDKRMINTMEAILGAFIGLIISKVIIEPVRVHKIQDEMISKGYPKPDTYKEHIWF